MPTNRPDTRMMISDSTPEIDLAHDQVQAAKPGAGKAQMAKEARCKAQAPDAVDSATTEPRRSSEHGIRSCRQSQESSRAIGRRVMKWHRTIHLAMHELVHKGSEADFVGRALATIRPPETK
jgi:hypothetical protein